VDHMEHRFHVVFLFADMFHLSSIHTE
jgi:hypothetical protein